LRGSAALAVVAGIGAEIRRDVNAMNYRS